MQFKLARRHATGDLEWERRAATLGGILTSLVTVSIAFVAGLMVLRELSIDIVPIMTGAGIAGWRSASRTESRARCHLGIFPDPRR